MFSGVHTAFATQVTVNFKFVLLWSQKLPPLSLVCLALSPFKPEV